MTNKNDKKSFWTTLPGILSGIAAVITAIATLYIAFHGTDVGFNDGKMKPTPTSTPPTPPPEAQPLNDFIEQGSYTGDCSKRPEGSVCIKYEDGYVWLVYDAILGWEENGYWQEKKIVVAKGGKADYYHILETPLVKEVQK